MSTTLTRFARSWPPSWCRDTWRPELRERLRQAGRDPKSAPVSIFFAPPKKPALDALEAADVERAIFGVPSEGRDAVLPRLDAYAALIRP